MTPPKPTRRFDLIAFDWDGTLSDSTALIASCIQQAVADVGGTVPSTAAASHVIGLGLMQALAHAAPDVPAERHAALADRYRHHYFAQQHTLTLFPGVIDMLQELRAQGYLLAVATGKSRRGLDEALKNVALQGMFDTTRTADQTRGKPHPQMLHEIFAELAVEPQRTLMVGDTTHDLELARNAACPSAAVTYGAHPPHAFAALGPLCIAESVPQLRAWILQNG
jgi:phosphoglycolate phosphatase